MSDFVSAMPYSHYKGTQLNPSTQKDFFDEFNNAALKDSKEEAIENNPALLKEKINSMFKEDPN